MSVELGICNLKIEKGRIELGYKYKMDLQTYSV
jgi:hypothetical protein